jgi:hypothetical protein
MNYTFLLPRLLFLQILSLTTLSAVEANAYLPSWLEHLTAGEVETIELHTDLEALLQRESTNDEYQDATITYTDKSDQVFNWNLGIKPRGKYRRRVCDFPPLKLNFSKKELRTSGLAEFDKFKLVTHCSDDRLASKEAVIKEYLTYQLYQELSPNSFRVHLLRIRYVDTKGKLASFQRYGIIIESEKELERRLNAVECEDCFVTEPSAIDASAENKLAVFQYMIGNTDFSVAQGRNLKYFTLNNGGPLLPVPYDFDFAALVAPSYAVPTRHLGQQKLTDRVYLGFVVSDSLMEQTLTVFEAKREKFLDIIGQEKRLSLTARSEMRLYINDFFTTIDTLKQHANGKRTYYQLRQSAPEIVPDGGNPVHYGISR